MLVEIYNKEELIKSYNITLEQTATGYIFLFNYKGPLTAIRVYDEFKLVALLQGKRDLDGNHEIIIPFVEV